MGFEYVVQAGTLQDVTTHELQGAKLVCFSKQLAFQLHDKVCCCYRHRRHMIIPHGAFPLDTYSPSCSTNS